MLEKFLFLNTTTYQFYLYFYYFFITETAYEVVKPEMEIRAEETYRSSSIGFLDLLSKHSSVEIFVCKQVSKSRSGNQSLNYAYVAIAISEKEDSSM